MVRKYKTKRKKNFIGYQNIINKKNRSETF